LATRIVELDRGRLFDWACDYPTFLKRKEEWLAAEERQEALFDKRLAQEGAWIRKGIEARRTRNEGRVRALEAMREARRRREERTVRQNVRDYETITIDGQPRHVLGYLQDFLFPPERSKSLVKFLSGGERSRLLLAKLFTRPSNVLVLDEPTNDLDIETLELL